MGKRVSKVRLIDSNFPLLGLRPPLCCVYVAPLPAGSIRSLPLAHPAGFVYVARFPSAPLIDSPPRSSTLSRFPVYPSRLPPDVFPRGTVTRQNQKNRAVPFAIARSRVSCSGENWINRR